MDNTHRVKQIEQRLTEHFQPDHLKVLDESYKHVGHAGYKTGKGHFKVIISANQLTSLSKISAHRAIYQALDDLMETDIHALSIQIT